MGEVGEELVGPDQVVQLGAGHEAVLDHPDGAWGGDGTACGERAVPGAEHARHPAGDPSPGAGVVGEGVQEAQVPQLRQPAAGSTQVGERERGDLFGGQGAVLAEQAGQFQVAGGEPVGDPEQSESLQLKWRP